MMQETWMPPRPEGAHAVHLDGDTTNNAAPNLAWAHRKPRRAYVEAWAERKLSEMADPGHPDHGTRTGYDAGCRCERCRRRMRLEHRAYQTRLAIARLEDACRTTSAPRP